MSDEGVQEVKKSGVTWRKTRLLKRRAKHTPSAPSAPPWPGRQQTHKSRERCVSSAGSRFPHALAPPPRQFLGLHATVGGVRMSGSRWVKFGSGILASNGDGSGVQRQSRRKGVVREWGRWRVRIRASSFKAPTLCPQFRPCARPDSAGTDHSTLHTTSLKTASHDAPVLGPGRTPATTPARSLS